LKSKAVVPERLERIIAMVHDPIVLLKLDESLKSIDLVDSIPLETTIFYSKYNKVMIVGPRDMCFLSTVHRVYLTLPSSSFILDFT
jgi:hypothetical protein